MSKVIHDYICPMIKKEKKVLKSQPIRSKNENKLRIALKVLLLTELLETFFCF